MNPGGSRGWERPGGGLGPAAGLAARLALNGVRHRLGLRRGAAPRLQALSVEVTGRCIARCRMCDIWRTGNAVPDPPLDVLLSLWRSPALGDLRELDLTGGEPFLRDDLGDLLVAVAGLRPAHLRWLRSVAVTTNALLTARVVAGVARAAPVLDAASLDLVLACGVDAVGPLHDEVRGVPGAWERVDATLTRLLELRARHPRLILGLKVTVGPWNVDRLAELGAYAADRELFTIVSPCIVTANRYRNAPRRAELELDGAGRERFARYLEDDPTDWAFHGQALRGWLRTGRMSKPCTAGSNYAFVRSNGDLYPCPVIDRCAGNTFAAPLEKVLADPAVSVFARRAGRHRPCGNCTEPGLERFSLPREGFAALGLLARLGPRRWVATLRRAGLEKFL